jgi:hypothetical protein
MSHNQVGTLQLVHLIHLIHPLLSHVLSSIPRAGPQRGLWHVAPVRGWVHLTSKLTLSFGQKTVKRAGRGELYSRATDVHGLIRLSTRIGLHESGPSAFDLYTSSRLLLNILDEHSLGSAQPRQTGIIHLALSPKPKWATGQSDTDRNRNSSRHGETLTPGPTAFALTLKCLDDSNPIMIFSSGHFCLLLSSICAGIGNPNALFLAINVRSSINGPRSCSIRALIFSVAALRAIWVLAVMWM